MQFLFGVLATLAVEAFLFWLVWRKLLIRIPMSDAPLPIIREGKQRATITAQSRIQHPNSIPPSAHTKTH